jgi:hypothetical protein
MSFFSRLFSSSKDQDLPSLTECLDVRGIQPDLPGLSEEFIKGFDMLNSAEREAAADAIAALLSKGLPLPPPWAEAQYELLPQIVPAWVAQRDPYYYRPCFENLSKRLLAGDKPVPEEWLTLWDIADDEVMEIALDHLEERTKNVPFVRQPSGIYRSGFGDGLDASRILLPHHWNNLFPGQNTFIAIPLQSALFVAPQVLLPKLVDAITSTFKESGSSVLALTMYQSADTKLMPASLQEPHPMIQPQREFRQLDSLAAYAAQSEQLAKMQIGVACPLDIVKTQQGRSLTVAAWTDGKPALVPDSDLIGFISSKGRPLGLYWRQTLPRLARIKGEQVDIWGPRRLAFKEFPTSTELEELECFANAEIHAKVLNPKGAQQGASAPISPQVKQAQQAQAASSALSSNNSPVPAHLRGLSLGVQSDDSQ